MSLVEVQHMRRAALVMWALAFILLFDIVVITWLYPEERDLTFWVMLASTFGVFLIWAGWAACLLHCGRGHGTALTLLSIMVSMTVVGAMLTIFVHKPHGETGRPPWAEWTVHAVRAFSGAYLLFAFIYMIWESVRLPKQRS